MPPRRAFRPSERGSAHRSAARGEYAWRAQRRSTARSLLQWAGMWISRLLACAVVAAPALATAENVEVGVGLGYAQGNGQLGDYATSLENTASPGGALQLDASYRVRPDVSLGAYATLSDHSGVEQSDIGHVSAATTGVQATYHLRRAWAADPWVSGGIGWKTMWLEPRGGTTRSFHGIELARVQVGTDVRVSPTVSVSPVVGVSASTFLGQRIAMELVGIEEREIHVTGFLGVAGRFHL